MYPLQANLAPQKVGGLITYARRYCLCAVTGIAAAGDDDNASGAQAEHRQSAGDVFEQAAPARPRENSNGAPRAEVTRPAQALAAVPEDAEPDQDAQQYADLAQGATTLSEIEEIHQKAREGREDRRVHPLPGQRQNREARPLHRLAAQAAERRRGGLGGTERRSREAQGQHH